MADTSGNEFRENQLVVTAKRALGLNKFYVAIAIAIGVGVLIFLNPTYINTAAYTSATNHTGVLSSVINARTGGDATLGLPLLAVPFTVLPMMMLTTTMVILFVYDKNNGVLEYLISLGMNQRSIYMRYMGAALLNAVCYLLVFGILNLIYSYIQFGTKALGTMLLVLGIGTVIAVSTVAFIMTMMMIFSVLQKARSGGNQPLAVTLGLIVVFPGYFIPFIFPYNTAVAVEIGIAILIAAVAILLMLLSGKYINREKFLP